MASLGFKLLKFQVLLRDDDGKPLKHVGGNIKRMYSQTSVHELNSFLKVVRKPKLFSP